MAYLEKTGNVVMFHQLFIDSSIAIHNIFVKIKRPKED